LTSASAYQAYLQGRYHWNKPGIEGVEDALSYYTEALRLDSRFAPAHAGVARVYVTRAEYYREQPRRALETARTSAKHALELDPGQSEAHLALGDVRRMLEWDWRGAENAYSHAIALNPSQENAHRGYGTLLVALARREEAVRESERACELDPLCLVVSSTAAWVRYLAGDYQAAMDHCRRTIDLDPQHLLARRIMAAAALQSGRTSDAIEVLDAAHTASQGDPVVTAWLAHAKAVTGDRAGATDLLARLRRLDRKQYLPPYHLALVHVGLGDIDSAFASLQTATVDCDPALPNVAVEPRFAPLRSDPRYARLLELLGL